jgi:hypothetical protein
MVEKHLLGYHGVLAQAEQLEDAVFLAGQRHWLVTYRKDAGLEVDDKVASSDCRLSVGRGTAYPRQWTPCPRQRCPVP